MVTIEFTRQVLGPDAARRLEQKQITQTLRSPSSDLGKIIDAGQLKFGDAVHIRLDKGWLGIAEISFFDLTDWPHLEEADAKRGGFETMDELRATLLRAGHRFRPLDEYEMYRVQFQWASEDRERRLKEANNGARQKDPAGAAVP